MPLISLFFNKISIVITQHSKSIWITIPQIYKKSRLLKFCCALKKRLHLQGHFCVAASNSTNQISKGGSTCHLSVYFNMMYMVRTYNILKLNGEEGVAHNHRHLSKVDCSSFLLCLQLVFALPKGFLLQLLTVLTRQAREAVHAINQSVFNTMSMVITHDILKLNGAF